MHKFYQIARFCVQKLAIYNKTVAFLSPLSGINWRFPFTYRAKQAFWSKNYIFRLIEIYTHMKDIPCSFFVRLYNFINILAN